MSAFDADGLPNPANDPAPLFAMVMNMAIRGTVALGGAVVQGAQAAVEGVGNAVSATTAVVSRHVDNFATKSSDTPETVRDVKQRMREQAIEAPALPEVAKSAAMGVERAEAITAEVRDTNLETAMGKQVVAASMERQQHAIGIA